MTILPIRPYGGLLIGMCFFASLLRVLHTSVLFYSPTADMTYYVDMAEQLFREQDPAFLNRSLLLPPGYGLWLAALTRLLGLSLMKPVLMVQALLSGLATAALMDATRRLYSEKAARWAGLLYAIHAPFVFSSGLLLSESLTISLLAIWLWLTIRSIETPSVTNVVLSGCFLGLAVHVRTNLLPLALPTVFAFLFCPSAPTALKVRFARTTLFVAAVGVVLLPWTLRNSLIARHPTFVAANTGMNLYQANNPVTDGGWPQFDSMKAVYTEYVPTGTTWAERDAQYVAQARQFMREHWAYELWYLIPRRITLLFESTFERVWPWFVESPGGPQDYPFSPYFFFPLIDIGALVVLSVLGLALRPRLAHMRWYLPACGVVFLFPLLIVHAGVRFRFPLDVFLLPLAGVTLAALVDHHLGKKGIRWLLGAYGLMVLGGSALNTIRFRGENLLADPQWSQPLSPLAAQLTTSTVTLRGPITEPFWEVKVRAGTAPELLLAYDYAIRVADKTDYQGPNLKWEFFNDRGLKISFPVGDGAMLAPRHRLNRFQETTTTAWHVIAVPPLATHMRLTLANDVKGTVTLARARLRGPVWLEP